MKVFISYARPDQDRVEQIARHLTEFGRDVWFDEELRGGQDWWDVILQQIRSCDLLLFVLSPDSVLSRACLREVTYAAALHRHVLPVKVRDVKPELAPEPLQGINFVNLLSAELNDWMGLMATVEGIGAPPPLADPPPDPPDAPVSDFGSLRERLAEPVLGSDVQHDIVSELRERARNPDDRRAAAALMQQLAGRSDLDDDVADQVDQLLTTYETLDERMSELMANLVGELSDRHCTPILGTGLADSLLGSRRSLAQEWAKSVRFPMAPHQRDDLPQVAQYVAVTKSPNQVRRDLGRFYLDKLSASVEDDGEELAGAGLDERIKLAWRRHVDHQKVDAYAVLASLPIPIYVTTEWTTHLSDALETTDPPKSPIVEFCRWNPDVRRWPEPAMPRGYIPDAQHPLVLHVFGKLDVPESLVITEDNFFDFLVSVAEDRSLIPLVVQEALSNSSLLFLGFGLEDWDVRVLLRSLINREVAERLRRNFKHVAAQLDSRDWLNAERARAYLETYFKSFREPPIDIFWGTVERFTAELGKAWERAGSGR